MGSRPVFVSHTKKVPAPYGARTFLVRATGLEPARRSQRNLNPPSLPIPPRPQIKFPEYFITTQGGCQLPRRLLSRMGKLYQKFRRFPLTFRQSTSRIDSVWCTLKIAFYSFSVSWITGGNCRGFGFLRLMAFCFLIAGLAR